MMYERTYAVGLASRLPLAVTDAAQMRSRFRVAGGPMASNAAEIPQGPVQIVSPAGVPGARGPRRPARGLAAPPRSRCSPA